jgi:hypothetical protein
LRLAATELHPRTPPPPARYSLTLGWTDRVPMWPDPDCLRLLWSLCQALALSSGPLAQPMAWDAATVSAPPPHAGSPARSPGAISRRHEAATGQTTALAGLGWGLCLMRPVLQTGQAVAPLLSE